MLDDIVCSVVNYMNGCSYMMLHANVKFIFKMVIEIDLCVGSMLIWKLV